MSIKKRIFFLLLCVVIPMILGLGLATYKNQQHARLLASISATVFPDPIPIADFELADHTGAKFSNENLVGTWSFIFFGYTHCPDICPITLSVLNQVDEMLRKSNIALPKTIFVSVDPKRDSADSLASYLAYFNKEFIGVTGDLINLQSLTGALGAPFSYQDYAPGENYDVSHSARIMLLDPQGRFKALLSLPNNPTVISEEYSKIITL